MGDLRIGIIGCGSAARVHLGRLAAIPGVAIVGCADLDGPSSRSMAELAPRSTDGAVIPAFGDHVELIHKLAPDAVAIFTPHLAHYRPTIDALQADCHVFIEKPLSTNVQEAVDIVNVARRAAEKVGVGHQFRLLPSLVEARRLIAEGAIGAVRLATATLAQPWLASHGGAEHSWRFDPRISGGGMLADSGNHLIDALLWSLGQVATEVAAIQARLDSGVDLVTAATIRTSDGAIATLGLSGNSPRSLFELTFYGESGDLRATEAQLIRGSKTESAEVVPLPAPIETIDGNFAASIRDGSPLCCPADDALDTVRLLEAIARSAAIGQIVRLG